MKILLVTLDSKFIHANLAVRYLKKYCRGFDIVIKEFTINQKIEYLSLIHIWNGSTGEDVTT